MTAQIPLSPLPTNAANDAGVDGIVTIASSTAASQPTQFVFQNLPTVATAGVAFTVTVAAENVSNNIVTGYNGTVNVGSTDSQASLPTQVTFTNGMATFTATLKTAALQSFQITTSPPNSITGSSNGISVVPTAPAAFVISGLAAATPGIPTYFTVTTVDQFGNPVPYYSGDVLFTSTDPQAIGLGTMSVGSGQPIAVVFGTIGTQYITVTDMTNPILTGNITLTGTSPPIVVGPSFVLSGLPAFVNVGTPFSFTVTAMDLLHNNTDTVYTGPVHFSSSDGLAALPANATLANGVGVFSATLNTAGYQTLTVTDATYSALTGNGVVTVASGPYLESINRATPAGPSTNAATVAYTVTFSKAVTGVSASDFQLALTGTVSATIAQVTPVSGAVYTVTVSGITGIGTLGLNLVYNTSIHDLAGNPLNQGNLPVAFAAEQTFATGDQSRSVAIGDLTGDGKSDLVVTNELSDSVSVLLGNGNGTFQAQQTFAAGDSAKSVALGDLTGDGKTDIVVANELGNTVSVLLGNGNGTFQAQQTFATGLDPASVAIGDVNGDGKPDLVVANLLANGPYDTISVLLGNGNGTFQAQQTFAAGTDPNSVKIGDVNGDGKPDIVVANVGSNTVGVLLGNGNGTFQAQKTFAAGNHPGFVALGDVNGDGNPDIVVTNENGNSVSVLLGNGNGTFQAQQTFATGSFPASVAIGDVTGDGKPDLVVANWQGYTVSVLVGNGDGTFLTQQTFASGYGPYTGYGPYALALGDVTGDGKLDVVVASGQSNTVGVLQNLGNPNFTGQVYYISSFASTQFAIAVPGNAATWMPFTVTVTAENGSGATLASFTGTVHFSSSDSQAVLPADATLTNGVGIFSVTLNTVGSQTITVDDLVNANIAATSSPISVNANAAPNFVVTSLTPTSTGFTATFNEPFNPGTISLYDMAGVGGPDDMTLTGPGAPQISIRGSLIIDPTDTTITFDKTSNFTGVNFNPSTGVLAAGTYTVTFRSGTNGFKDVAGELLAGNIGGVPGDNYVATFVVSSPPVVVGIPSFARGPGDTINLPNAATFGIPLNLSKGTGVTGGQFTLQYNSALLNITAATVNAALASATMSLDASSSPGNAVIDFSSPTALTQTGMIRLGGLTATVPNAAVYGSTALLHFSGETLNGGAVAVEGDDAVQVVDEFGDTNGDGALSAGDAAQIARVATGLDVSAAAGTLGGFSGFPLINPVIIADLNNDSLVDASDVTLLNSYLTGTPRTQIPTPQATTPVTPTGASVHLSIPTNLTVSPGGTVVVPVNIDNPDPQGSGGLAGINLAIDFDPTVFTVSTQGITQGTLTAAWPLPTVNIGMTGNPAVPNGQIAIAFESATPITTAAGGSLLLITFQANANAAGGPSAINLAATNAPFGNVVTTRLDSLTAQIPLAPAPTNGATDAGVDGIVTIAVPGVTMSMPEDLSANPASTVTVPLDISSLDDPVLGDTGATGASIVIYYNPNVFTVAASDVGIGTIATNGSTASGSGYSPANPNGWSTTTNASNSGVLIIALSNAGTGVVTGTGSGSLVTVNFHVNPSAPHGKTIIDLAADAGVIANVQTELVDDSFGNYVLNPKPVDNTGNTPDVAEAPSPVDGVVNILGPTLAVSGPSQASTGVPFTFTVTAQNSDGSTDTGYTGTVHFTSTDSAASLPANATLTAGVGTFTVALKTLGSQTVSVTDSSDAAITGTSPTITVNTLQVSGLIPTSTGFVATFSEPFNPTQINLYDTLDTYGADDVTLVGPAPSTAFVRGSLLIDPTDTTITFVKTSDFIGSNFNPATGLLAPGTYSVTFRSAANGFTDLSGGLLNGNGSADSNYTATFVVAAPPVVVGVPSFARGPGNTVSLPVVTNNGVGGIPFNLSSGAGATEGMFTLQYNPALLDITGATPNPALAGEVFSLDASSTPGNAVLDFSSPTALAAGVAHLGTLQATVPNTAASIYKATSLLHIAGAQLNNGAIAVVGDDAVQVNAYLGDAFGTGTLSAGDSFLLARVSVGLDTNASAGVLGGFSAFRLVDPAIIGDISGSGNVNGADITLMNCLLVGLPRPQLPPLPTGLTIVPTGPDPLISLPADLQVAPDGTIVVPVDIDTADPAGSTGMTEAILALRFDPTLFSVSANDVQLGSLPDAAGGWQLTTMINAQTGEIGIDLFSGTAIHTTAGGSLVTITMRIVGSASGTGGEWAVGSNAGAAPISLVTQVDPTGQRVFTTTVADSQGAFVLQMNSGQWQEKSGQWAVGSGQLAVANTPMAAEETTLDPQFTAHYPLPTAHYFDAAFELAGLQQAELPLLQPAYRNDNDMPEIVQVEDWLGVLAQTMASVPGTAVADSKDAALLEPDDAADLAGLKAFLNQGDQT